MQHPRITDVVLTADARWVLSQLEREREAAREEQGYPERVQDWWAAPTMVGKKKRKGKISGKKEGAAAIQSGSAEGIQDGIGALGLGEEAGGEDGRILSEEELEFEGFESPVMMSPAGSMVGEEEEEEE